MYNHAKRPLPHKYSKNCANEAGLKPSYVQSCSQGCACVAHAVMNTKDGEEGIRPNNEIQSNTVLVTEKAQPLY